MVSGETIGDADGNADAAGNTEAAGDAGTGVGVGDGGGSARYRKSTTPAPIASSRTPRIIRNGR